MITKQHVMSVLAAFVLVLTPAVAVAPAYAATTTPSVHQNFFQGLVQFLAQKFGLDQGQVQSAVDDFRTQHKEQVQQQLQTKENTHLDTLVSQGKITAAQKQQILDEQAKLRSEYDPSTFKNLTPDQRKQKFQQEQAEMQAWSKSTGIDAKYLRPGFMRFGRMRMFNRWDKNAVPSVTPSPSI